jgi:hypothetical protein
MGADNATSPIPEETVFSETSSERVAENVVIAEDTDFAGTTAVGYKLIQ